MSSPLHRAIAPGKLILSGEHAVVYGKPAVVTAVNRYVETSLADRGDGLFSFAFPEIRESSERSLLELRDLVHQVERRYGEFLEGDCPIGDVLEKPLDLIELAAGIFMKEFDVWEAGGFRVALASTVPVGCGMGSSASAVMSLFAALAARFGVDAGRDKLFELGLQAERTRHGKPSGADPYVTLHGGIVRFQAGKALPLNIALPALTLVHTGVPESGTGECVMTVARNFKESGIWEEFENVTLRLENALALLDTEGLKECVRSNHRLLSEIGVVPDKTATFIRDVEEAGGAAKVCGAGAVAGEGGGIVWVVDAVDLEALCERYGYEILIVEGDPDGARAV